MMRTFLTSALAIGLALLALSGVALAEESLAVTGHAHDWQMGFQPAVTPVAESIHEFHEILLYLITAITIFVLGLLLYVMARFNARRNPVPSKTAHNTTIEVLWTVVPVIILVAIAIPSFKLLYLTDHSEDAEMVVKVTGNTWNWTIEYPDNGGFSFTASMLAAEEVENPELVNLAVDNVAVIPSGTKIKFQVTSNDTLHAFTIPSFAVKVDAVPGRLNETWAEVSAEYEGITFYGQCSELCGVGHAFMPIAFKVVSPAEFEAWVAEAQAQFGAVDQPATITVAQQ